MVALIQATLICVIILYAPGYLLVRTCGLARFASFALAPIATCFFFVVLGVVLELAGVSWPAFALPLVVFAIGTIAFVIRVLLRRKRGLRALGDGAADDWRQWGIAALYVAVASVIVAVVFVPATGGDPGAFARNDDTTTHLSVVRAFLDTGYYSTLKVNSYANLGLGGSYYPAEWHIVVAVVASFLDGAVALASSGATIAFVAVVFPVSVLYFLQQFFPSRTGIWISGSLFSAAFCGFPWGFLVWGQLLSNMVSFAFVLPAFALFAGMLESSSVADRIGKALALLMALGAMAFAQPNGVFVFYIGASAYLIEYALRFKRRGQKINLKKRVLCAALMLAGAVVVWLMLLKVPFLQEVINATWPAIYPVDKAVAYGLFLKFSDLQGIQWLVALMVFCGAVRSLGNRQNVWLVASWAFSVVIFVVDASSDGPLKHILSGFWYTDYARVGAMVVLFAIPLASNGFDWILRALTRAVRFLSRGRFEGPVIQSLVAVCMTALLFWSLFFPIVLPIGSTHKYKPGLVAISDTLKRNYSWSFVQTGEEAAFIEQVKKIVPPGALIVNVPNDGSAWAYGAQDLNTLFRRAKAWGGTSTAEESEIIRTKLCDINDDEEVRKVVDDLGAKYVMLLDDPSGVDRTLSYLRYSPDDWRGIESITPDTPGFKLLLSEGDMRLYEITQ